MVYVQYPVYLREMPSESAGEVGFAYVLVSHALVEDYLNGGEGGQGDLYVAPGGGRRNISAVVDPGGYGFLKGI